MSRRSQRRVFYLSTHRGGPLLAAFRIKSAKIAKLA